VQSDEVMIRIMCRVMMHRVMKDNGQGDDTCFSARYSTYTAYLSPINTLSTFIIYSTCMVGEGSVGSM
jgi:hypothetical protein